MNGCGKAYENYLRGKALMENGDYRAAMRYFKVSSEQDAHFKTYECMHQCHLSLNEPDKAFSCIETAYKLNPRSDKTAVEYSGMLLYYGRKDEAEKILQETICRNPVYKPAEKKLNDLRKL